MSTNAFSTCSPGSKPRTRTSARQGARRRSARDSRDDDGTVPVRARRPQAGIEVLEIGGLAWYSTIWLAGRASARWPRRLVGARSREVRRGARTSPPPARRWAQLVEGDAHATLAATQDTSISSSRRREGDYETLFALARPRSNRAGSSSRHVVSHVETLGATRPRGRPIPRCRASPWRWIAARGPVVLGTAT